MKLRLKHFLKFTSLLLYLFVLSCEDVELALPGNTQPLDPVAPSGDIVWAIDTDENGEKGYLEENSASGKTIGTLNATDGNPDDVFTYSIKSQKIDNSGVNYFILTADSGNVNLVLNNGNLNYEALTGSRIITVLITVTDDSPDNMTDDFEIKVEVINVNETPIFNNFNSLTRYADEYILYEFNKIEWSDTDDGQNPTLTHNGPSWLDITSEGLMSGTPQANDVGNNAYTITITDGEISVTENLTIEVRENIAPQFSNSSSIQTVLRVGCWDDNQTLVDLNWYDPNNTSPYFQGTDLVTFANEESIEWFNITSDGVFLCVNAPSNSDAGVSPVSLSLTDNRPNVPLSSVYSFDLTVTANDAPGFSNLNDFQSTISVGDTLDFDLDWQDPQEDQIVFIVTENLSWFTWDGSGNIVAIPSSNNIGDYNLIFTISDGCYEVIAERTLTVQ
jgi:hypothetical protein